MTIESQGNSGAGSAAQDRWASSHANALHFLIDAERSRFFLWAPVAFGAGIAFYFALPTEPGWLLAIMPLTAALGMRVLLRALPLGAAAATAICLMTAGFADSKFRVEYVRAPVLSKPASRIDIEGEVLRVESRPPRGQRLTISVQSMTGIDEEHRPSLVRIRTLSKTALVAAGDRIRLKANVAPPSKPALPGGFDYARAAWFERVGGVGYAYSAPAVLPSKGPTPLWSQWLIEIEHFRAAIGARIKASLSGEEGAIATALITGERGGISEATNTSYKNAGLFHILSISGLHMVIMAGAVFYVVRLGLAALPSVALRFPIKKWAAVCGIAGALAYMTISGGAFATVRSALMIVVMFAAVLLERPALALRNVAVSALLIMLIYPESVFDAGFQMSFAAVTGLVATYEEVRRRAQIKREPHPLLKVMTFFGGIVSSTLVASFAVAPFAVYHFHQSQQYAVLANLIAIPVCNMIVMPAALATLLLMPLGLEALALRPMGVGIQVMSWCAESVAVLPGAVGHIPAIPTLAFALLVLGGLWLALWQTALRFGGIVLAMLGLAIAPLLPRPDVYVARGGALVAVRGADGRLNALPARQSKFEMERWLEYDGDSRTAGQSQTAKDFSCDSIGCVTQIKGLLLAVALKPAAIAEDCASARILILTVPRPKTCNGPDAVIDFFDLWRDGPYAIYVNASAATGEATLAIDSVAAHRGDRPWAPTLQRWPQKLASNGAKSSLSSEAKIGGQTEPEMPRAEIEDDATEFLPDGEGATYP